MSDDDAIIDRGIKLANFDVIPSKLPARQRAGDREDARLRVRHVQGATDLVVRPMARKSVHEVHVVKRE